ncbi:hypothetical protein K239x_29400 [Planctomycetes bacterium K23_9]|uniref:Uncharacterized protein n=1 Tax=Stieleria marina TaxID=1930275 RepID=A0A517NUY9_9BACT|nr:hypothetical protein K239x_29400 [Planctomycetes bacterium K23_9]
MLNRLEANWSRSELAGTQLANAQGESQVISTSLLNPSANADSSETQKDDSTQEELNLAPKAWQVTSPSSGNANDVAIIQYVNDDSETETEDNELEGAWDILASDKLISTVITE